MQQIPNVVSESTPSKVPDSAIPLLLKDDTIVSFLRATLQDFFHTIVSIHTGITLKEGVITVPKRSRHGTSFNYKSHTTSIENFTNLYMKKLPTTDNSGMKFLSLEEKFHFLITLYTAYFNQQSDNEHITCSFEQKEDTGTIITTTAGEIATVTLKPPVIEPPKKQITFPPNKGYQQPDQRETERMLPVGNTGHNLLVNKKNTQLDTLTRKEFFGKKRPLEIGEYHPSLVRFSHEHIVLIKHITEHLMTPSFLGNRSISHPGFVEIRPRFLVGINCNTLSTILSHLDIEIPEGIEIEKLLPSLIAYIVSITIQTTAFSSEKITLEGVLTEMLFYCGDEKEKKDITISAFKELKEQNRIAFSRW